MSTTVNPANDIRKQAHQGSVAAIIQVLNDELADLGVRTRAVFDNRVLQLLCEAETEEQLSVEVLPQRVKTILEEISPRSIRRVNINSRIVREQQLLWLDEINRDPDSQVLWSKEITLARQNVIKYFFEDVQASLSGPSTSFHSHSPRQQREKQQFWRGTVSGLGLSVLLLLLGGGLFYWLKGASNETVATNSTTSSTNASPVAVAPSPATTNASTAVVKTATSPVANPGNSAIADPFAAAVRLAEEASTEGTKAQAPGEWQAIADKWGKASELMAQVPTSDKRYSVAQDRTGRYKNNQTAALQKAR
ncbi:hypothetical protein [Alkalinema sp. FACHB-956]|uniref:hypothetical protein n=1 Tax=Alkalinema sp. FACHB-956 TaxID=2692768 RepID=UPI001688FD31|nr:hypothetical protein [Alkalinema sp. FACHB-956]MBD2326754.1 hypothetical protein [Alkalinema sp. FACHB-956]